MSFLRKLFGKKPAAVAAATTIAAGTTVTRADGGPATSPPLPGATDPAQDPNLIRVFDSYGREMFITKQEWRDSVLVGHLQKVWNQPDELYSVIIQSLNDGFVPDMIKPEAALRRLAADLLRLLTQEAGFERTSPPGHYRAPAGDNFGHYLLRLEQLLAVRCSTMDGVPTTFLSGEREIIDGNLQLCLAEPDNVVPRLLLAQTLKRMQEIRTEVVAEYREKVALLQQEKPLPAPVQGVLQRLFSEVYP